MSEIDKTLEERGKRYGSFKTHADITQRLKKVMHRAPNWNELSSGLNRSQKEALDMLAHKIGRILNGDPNYIDSWRDCIGYLQLVLDELQTTEGATDCRIVRRGYKNGEWIDE